MGRTFSARSLALRTLRVFGQVPHQGFHHLTRASLEGTVWGWSWEVVAPLEDFGKAMVVEGVDDGVDGCFGADDEDFDGLAVGFGVGVELEGDLNPHGFRHGRRFGKEGLRLHVQLQEWHQFGCHNNKRQF